MEKIGLLLLTDHENFHAIFTNIDPIKNKLFQK